MRLPCLLTIAMGLMTATSAVAADDRPQLQEEVRALPIWSPPVDAFLDKHK